MMKMIAKLLPIALLAAASGSAWSQSWGPRNLEELKEETLDRARNAEGPIGRVKMEDAERAMANLHTLERDDWAGVWSEIAEEYLAKAKAATSDEEARENYMFAWRYFDIGRWPTEKHSAGKREAYDRGREAFIAYGKLLDPPVEVVRIPFEDTEIVAYLRIPDVDGPAPLVFGMNGLDSRKEGVMAGSQNFIDNGIAAFAIDMPGTGQAPLLIDVGSERYLSIALDYLVERPEIDASRIVVQSRSWSGYWAAVLGYTERERLAGVAVHGVGIHGYFQPEWQKEAVNSLEYLFDLVSGAVRRLRCRQHGRFPRLWPASVARRARLDRSTVGTDAARQWRARHAAADCGPVLDDEARRPEDGLGQPGRRTHGALGRMARRAHHARNRAAVVDAPSSASSRRATRDSS